MMQTSQKTERTGPSGAGRRKTLSPLLPRIATRDGISVERQAYQALRYALMTGQILPGARLTSRSLSEALGVSPTPVREALKRLEGDGALVSKSKSAFFVNDPDATGYGEILEIRLNLESLAIRKAAAAATEAALKPARRINDMHTKLLKSEPANTARSLALNFRFHFELYKLSGSKTLVSMIESLWLRIGPALHKYTPASDDNRICSFHGRMLDAVARHDADAAEAAVREDLSAAGESIIAQLRRDDGMA